MSMGHGPSGRVPTGGVAGLRGLRRDRTVLGQKIKPGTAKRMLGFAKPYKKILIFFMVAVVAGSVVSAVNPLILRALIDKRI